jgi:hypothetical protein
MLPDRVTWDPTPGAEPPRKLGVSQAIEPTSGSGPVMALVGGLLGRAYRRRILAEEQLLGRELPGFAAYAERTKKLIPGVW